MCISVGLDNLNFIMALKNKASPRPYNFYGLLKVGSELKLSHGKVQSEVE